MLKIERREYQNRTFRLPVSLIERLSELAQEKNMAVNHLVVILCEYALEHLDDDADSDVSDSNS